MNTIVNCYGEECWSFVQNANGTIILHNNIITYTSNFEFDISGCVYCNSSDESLHSAN